MLDQSNFMRCLFSIAVIHEPIDLAYSKFDSSKLEDDYCREQCGFSNCNAREC